MKFGTFYYEFKNNKGLLSVYFYVFYFSRRLQFMLTQIYLNESELTQNLLNMCMGYIMIGFLIYYRPFKDSLIQYANLASEICFSCIFTTFMVYSIGDNLIELKTYQFIVIFTVIGCMVIQFCIALIQFIVSAKEFYLKLLEIRNKFISNECKSNISNVENILNRLE